MDSKGQGALEYLLLIGGAILIAAIVIAILTSVGNQGKTQTRNAQLLVENRQSGLENIANYP